MKTNHSVKKIAIPSLLFCLGLAVPLCGAQTTDPRDDASPWGISVSAETFGDHPKFNPLLKDAGAAGHFTFLTVHPYATTKMYFYESINGYKPTGASWDIPQSDGWLEHSWRVTDANFVGQWGYNV